jgi:DHA1 family bicyclomycin/chloramphenicol resistance-like MFS transporter
MAAAVVCSRALLRDLYEPREGAQRDGLGHERPGPDGHCQPGAGWRAWRPGPAGALCAGGGGAGGRGGAGLRGLAGARDRCAAAPRRHAARVLLATWGACARPPGVRRLGAADQLHLRRPVHHAGRLVLRLHRRAGPVAGRLRPGAGQRARWPTSPAPSSAGAGWRRTARWCAVQRGAWFTLAGGLGMALPAALGVQSVWAIALPQMLFALGHGVHQPCSQAGAVGPSPTRPVRRRRWPASCWRRWPSSSGCGWAARSTAPCGRWPMAWASGRGADLQRWPGRWCRRLGR